ncbi:putative uncharacterized protein DDB_G0288537 [Drosophila mojavensis]|uniref:putative uncharacterized protein DDB_G0288537 n=1 Tax=Drosophila mojavensis TaxID=7230 RepID=UPI001CD137B0|nr:putative uncharacterized protein DDB_G0288537 [Drosophila mojavensis]
MRRICNRSNSSSSSHRICTTAVPLSPLICWASVWARLRQLDEHEQQQVPHPLKKKPTLARRIRPTNSTSNKTKPLITDKPEIHTYTKLKQTAVSFQQQHHNEEDDLSSNSSSSSTFSSSSQQHSSVDYEAEDENEDKQRQRRHKDETDSLIHVQNFLKCFGANAATVRPPTATVAVAATVSDKVSATSSSELRRWRQSHRATAAATTTATVTSTITAATMSAIQATTTAPTITTSTITTPQTLLSNTKPQKFQINTKFLRKPRNKLMKMLPTTMLQQQQQQQQQQQPEQQTQLFIDDSNAKFKDFSIDSLLNK